MEGKKSTQVLGWKKTFFLPNANIPQEKDRNRFFATYLRNVYLINGVTRQFKRREGNQTRSFPSSTM